MRVTFVVNHRNMSGGVRVIAIYAEKLHSAGTTCSSSHVRARSNRFGVG